LAFDVVMIYADLGVTYTMIPQEFGRNESFNSYEHEAVSSLPISLVSSMQPKQRGPLVFLYRILRKRGALAKIPKRKVAYRN
jgi:hypothetical protein